METNVNKLNESVFWLQILRSSWSLNTFEQIKFWSSGHILNQCVSLFETKELSKHFNWSCWRKTWPNLKIDNTLNRNWIFRSETKYTNYFIEKKTLILTKPMVQNTITHETQHNKIFLQSIALSSKIFCSEAVLFFNLNWRSYRFLIYKNCKSHKFYENLASTIRQPGSPDFHKT